MTQATDNPATTQQGETQSAAQSQPTSTGQQDQRKGLSRRQDFVPSSLWAESLFSLMRRERSARGNDAGAAACRPQPTN